APNTKFRKSYDKLPASIAYTMDPTLDHCLLRPKLTQEISSNPNLATSFLRITASWMPLHLSNLFSHLCHLHLVSASIVFSLNHTENSAHRHPILLLPC
ncbi:hypothetical protein HMPREF1544_09964, partial [Mucor circinelloides 1006PhL]